MESNARKRVLVTGATGFVGRYLCRVLLDRGFAVSGTHRRGRRLEDGIEPVAIEDVGPETDWRKALTQVDAIIHLAARTELPRGADKTALDSLESINVAGTERLARAAVGAEVGQFVFMSSIKVHGERTFDSPFRVSDTPAPAAGYALSKWRAEQRLCGIFRESGLKVSIIRPPLIYGPGVGGNFLRLLRLVDKRLPLPFGAVDNRRSLVSLGNLADLIVRCLENPAALGETLLVSDGEDLSTPALIRALAERLGRRARLVPFPPSLLAAVAAILGQGDSVGRLIGSLQVDIAPTRGQLAWAPPFSLQQGLDDLVSWYRRTDGGRTEDTRQALAVQRKCPLS